MDLETRPRRAEGILTQEAPDSETLLLLDPDGGEYYTLEAVGRRVWELADGNRRVAEIAAQISEEYDVSLEIAEQDLLELLVDLSRSKLVVDG